ncbi:uncharacterized protein LTR77_004695 [Saxophila tyrrhenica]|uniref:DUF676 domain-containing protein n=1 Tax=Saxophila tyrrhenica TaxID=1690608 RepID=A0AAV9PAB0_9PEZI|nr:hypothetical protein LTR77_004695 [Saxophila tyrrhenica]
MARMCAPPIDSSIVIHTLRRLPDFQPTMASLPASTAEHLCVLVHGLWGNPNHLNYLRDTLQAQHPEDRLHILAAKSNADGWTYDGVEVGGERIANEIEQKIKELEQAGSKIKRISMIGYSLGGLVSRYAIGLLYKNGLFNDIEPVNFTTFATPHLGVRTPKRGYGAYIWNNLGSRTLSTSGQQMFMMDQFRDSGRPLLAVMSDQKSIFIKGLRMFKNKSLYANTINDRSVPYFTANISRTDPFVDLEKIDLNYLPGQDEPVILDPSHPVSPRKPKIQDLTYSQRLSMLSQGARTNLPFYAVMFLILPIGVPTFLVNSVYQSYKSAQRVKLHEAGQAGISLGRYRIPLLEEAQAVQDRVYERLTDTDDKDFLPTPPPEPQTPATSSTESLDEEQKLARKQSRKEDSDFPILALEEEQFDMIDSLDSLGIKKYPVHIQKHRHTHAAIVVRTKKAGFEEGEAVVKHWAEKFEV